MSAASSLVTALTDLQGIYMDIFNLLVGIGAASAAITLGRAYLRLKDF